MQHNQTSNPAARSQYRAAAPAPRVTPAPRRPSPAQLAVRPLAPIFSACQSRGLKCSDETRAARLYAVNRYLCNFNGPGFDWIESSFKELLGNTVAIIVIADAIEGGALTW